MPAVANRLADLAGPLSGGRLPVRLRGWDGTETGPAGAPVVTVRSARALRRLLWAPGELGLARGYVTGDIDVDGDLAAGLSAWWLSVRGESERRPHLSLPLLLRALATFGRLGGLGPPPPRPATEARSHGRLHSRRRDAASIAHHYDLSNSLYALLLDPSMAYSCGYWTRDEPSYRLADAQRDKLDLICRKLGLRPGSRLLDVGCGWGALAVHAARQYGAAVTGITLSTEQLRHSRQRVSDERLEHLVDLKLRDYRDLPAGESFDAVAVIEMGEHVGARHYPAFLAGLRQLLPEHGRLLIQQMSRGTPHPGGGPFIERYIAPDMHMRPLHQTVALIEQAGLEIRDVHALREHYVRTIHAWQAEFDARFDEVASLVGAEQARVWRLYLAGGALAFQANRMGVDQILAVRTATCGSAGMPAIRGGWEPGCPHVQPARR